MFVFGKSFNKHYFAFLRVPLLFCHKSAKGYFYYKEPDATVFLSYLSEDSRINWLWTAANLAGGGFSLAKFWAHACTRICEQIFILFVSLFWHQKSDPRSFKSFRLRKKKTVSLIQKRFFYSIHVMCVLFLEIRIPKKKCYGWQRKNSNIGLIFFLCLEN